MNLRGLLLGALAASLSPAGACAADAIIAEPESTEQVRVCDAYGAGFFYIPGTETCLQISGYVWFQVGAESFDDDGDTPDFFSFGGIPDRDGFIVSQVGRLNLDARSDTEWGLLRTFLRIEGDFNGYNSNDGRGEIGFDEAFIDFGGLRVGYTESAWSESQRGGVAANGSHSWGGLYFGYSQRPILSFSVGSEEGLAATISLEDDALEGEGYVPDVVGVISYNRPWGGVWAKAGFDEDRGDGESGFAAQAGLHYNIPNMEGSSFRLLGYYADCDNHFGTGHSISYLTGGFGNSEWSVLASYYQQFTERFGVSAAVQYFDDFYDGAFSDETTDLDGYAAEISVVWLPVENFEVRAEIQYDDVDELDGATSGFLRFTRYF